MGTVFYWLHTLGQNEKQSIFFLPPEFRFRNLHGAIFSFDPIGAVSGNG